MLLKSIKKVNSMILYNKRFEELVDKINKIQHMEIDIAVYMEITNNNDINLYIANNLRHTIITINILCEHVQHGAS